MTDELSARVASGMAWLLYCSDCPAGTRKARSNPGDSPDALMKPLGRNTADTIRPTPASC